MVTGPRTWRDRSGRRGAPEWAHAHPSSRRNAVAGAVALAVLAVVAAPGPAAAAPATQKSIFFPFHGSLLARGITVERNVAGLCSSASEVARRWDAWSCTAGGRAYDPCFSSSRTKVGAIAVCMTSPWSRATLLELRRSLPLALANVVGDPRTHAPWALTLATRERCALSTTRLGTIAGERGNYACAGSALLTGLPNRTRPAWTIRRAATIGARTTRRVVVARAWW